MRSRSRIFRAGLLVGVLLGLIPSLARADERIRIRIDLFDGSEPADLSSDTHPHLFELAPGIASVALEHSNVVELKEATPATYRVGMAPASVAPQAGRIDLVITPQAGFAFSYSAIEVRTEAQFANNPSSLRLLSSADGFSVPVETIPLDAARDTRAQLGVGASAQPLTLRFEAHDDFGSFGGGRAGFVATPIDVELALAPSQTLQYPGPPPCHTTLQACVDAAPPLGVVEVVTNGPIDESIAFEKSLTLRAGAGFAPRFPGFHTLVGATTVSGDHYIAFEGLILERGSVLIDQRSTGSLVATIRRLEIEEGVGSGLPTLQVRAGNIGPRGPIRFEIEDNRLRVPEGIGGGAIGIGVLAGNSRVLDGSVTGNQVVMEPNAAGAAIRFGSAHKDFRVDVIGNVISGSGFGQGIGLQQDGSGPVLAPANAVNRLTARVINNLVVGQAGNVGAPGGIVALANGGLLDATIVNNTLVGGEFGIRVAGRPDLGAEVAGLVANNLIAEQAQYGLAIQAGLAAENRHNLLFDTAADAFEPGPGTLLGDPLFVSPEDLRLAPGSPAIQAGDADALPLDVDRDLAGNPRVIDGVPEIGAHEFGLDDFDADGTLDRDDNCQRVANGPDLPDGGGNVQLDVDGDGFGNACDGDFDQGGLVGGPDFDTFLQCFNRPVGPGGPADDPSCAESDMDGSGFVGGPDFDLFLRVFNQAPGPSAATGAACGLGFEAALLATAIARLRRRRRDCGDADRH